MGPGVPYEIRDIPVKLREARRQCSFSAPATGEHSIHTVIVGARHPQHTKLPLVLVHGFMMGAPAFFKWLPLLEKERTVYAIDIIGMGGSSRPPFNASQLSPDEAEEFLVDPLEQWAAAMGLSAFVALGHSFGGFVVGAWALRHPGRIRQVGLLSPLLGFSEARAARWKPKDSEPMPVRALKCALDAAWAHHMTPHTLVRWVPGAKELFARASTGRFQSMAANVTDEEGWLLSEYIVATMDTPSSAEQALTVCFRPFLRPVGAASGGTITERLAGLKAPVFVVYGDRDWMDRASPRDLPNCEFLELSDSGHHLYLDNPAGLAAQVMGKLKKL